MNISIAFGGLLAVGFVLLIYGSLVKNKWGINPDRVSCPKCNTAFPQARSFDSPMDVGRLDVPELWS